MRGHAKPVVQRFSPTDRRRLERALSVAREARLYRRIEAVLLIALDAAVGPFGDFRRSLDNLNPETPIGDMPLRAYPGRA